VKNKTDFDVPQWYVIHTKPQQEMRAERNLSSWGIETFYPRIKKQPDAISPHSQSYLIKPFFPSYIFARFVVNDSLHKICFTRGVHSVVSFGGVPIAIENEIITILQSNFNEKDGLMRPSQQRTAPQLVRGDRVAIKEGPMKDFIGIFEQDLKAQERVMILLTAVNYQTRVIVHPTLIRKVS
jgi:transcriptional antiterminator RfaH